MGRTAGIRRPRRRFEPGGRAHARPQPSTPLRHPSPPPVRSWSRGGGATSPPLARFGPRNVPVPRSGQL